MNIKTDFGTEICIQNYERIEVKEFFLSRGPHKKAYVVTASGVPEDRDIYRDCNGKKEKVQNHTSFIRKFTKKREAEDFATNLRGFIDESE